MLIDTSRVDHLRVNFVAHFQTDNNASNAIDEINDIIDHYPLEMTSHLRQWFNDQQKHRPAKCLDDGNAYVQDLEEQIRQYDANPMVLKVRIS